MVKMITCKECKHWKRDENSKRGDCNSENFIYNIGDDKDNRDCLEYWDCESYGAGFNTGEDFGCIHGVI